MDEVDTDVYAISLDDVVALEKFAKDQQLNFKLLSDPDGSAARKFGVLSARGYANRVSFIIDNEGVLRNIIKDVNVGSHGTDMAAAVRKIRQGS